MKRKLIPILGLCGMLLASSVAANASDYSDYSAEQIESEITRLEGELEILYQLRDASGENNQQQETGNAQSAEAKELCYSGSGDDVLSIDPYGDWYVFEIEGNAEGRYFGVVAYDSNGERIGSLVNTTDVYSGILYDKSQDAATLEITATGDWTIKVKSLYTCKTGLKGSQVTGSGDDVILFYTDNGESSTAVIEGNQGERYFGIVSYDGSGNRCGSLVNTTDAYEGKVMLKKNPRIFEVTATGDWSILFE